MGGRGPMSKFSAPLCQWLCLGNFVYFDDSRVPLHHCNRTERMFRAVIWDVMTTEIAFQFLCHLNFSRKYQIPVSDVLRADSMQAWFPRDQNQLCASGGLLGTSQGDWNLTEASCPAWTDWGCAGSLWISLPRPLCAFTSWVSCRVRSCPGSQEDQTVGI